jgi:hypothetical protein
MERPETPFPGKVISYTIKSNGRPYMAVPVDVDGEPFTITALGVMRKAAELAAQNPDHVIAIELHTERR